MYRETHSRSLFKTVSYRFWSSVLTAILVLLITGQWLAALTIGSIEVFLKMALYFFHERIWEHIGFGRHKVKPAVIWFTGLPAAGKSTLAEALYAELNNMNLSVENLDGDVIRTIFPNTGFSYSERDRHIRRVGYLASRLEKSGVFVVAALISPYESSREFVRELCDSFVEVYVSTPLSVCEHRDPKGLYARARRGDLAMLTGVDDDYQPPQSPQLVIDTSEQTVDDCVALILNYLKLNKYI